jgi:hypothetical protein
VRPPTKSPTLAPRNPDAPVCPITDTLIDTYFARSADSFEYIADAFRGTTQPNYSRGSFLGTMGANGDGALDVNLGGADNSVVYKMSGGWRKRFNLAQAALVTISFSFKLVMKDAFEPDEYSEVMVSVGGTEYVFDRQADGGTIGFKTITFSATLPAGPHMVVFGLYLNKKTYSDECAHLYLDWVKVTQACPGPVAPKAPMVAPKPPVPPPKACPTCSSSNCNGTTKLCCPSPDKCIIVNCNAARLGTCGLTVTTNEGRCQYERKICTNPGEECNAATGKCEVKVCTY